MESVNPSQLKPERCSIELEETGWIGGGVPIEGVYTIDYIRRAKSICSDARAKSMKGEEKNLALSDALSNCKKAIDYQADVILHSFSFYTFTNEQKWGFQKKINFIQSLGVTAPNILRRINEKRNAMEHRHKYPTFIEVKDAIDVAELFYYATNRLSRLFISGGTVYTDTGEKFRLRLTDYSTIEVTLYGDVPENLKKGQKSTKIHKKEDVEKKEKTGDIHMRGIGHLLGPSPPKPPEYKFVFKYPEEDYFDWIRFLIQVQS